MVLEFKTQREAKTVASVFGAAIITRAGSRGRWCVEVSRRLMKIIEKEREDNEREARQSAL